MRTPVEWNTAVTKKIITEPMLEAALISVNKRAKNYRDKKKEYHSYRYSKIDYAWQAQQHQDLLYSYKEKLLSICTPVCIHQEFAGYPRIRRYDYQQDFAEEFFKAWKKHRISNVNSYYEQLDGDYWEPDDDDDGKRVWFFDVIDYDNPDSRYYLYYVVGDSTFHTPVSEDEVCQWQSQGLEVVKISALETCGADVAGLISLQFVRKILNLLEAKDFQFQPALFHNIPEYQTGWSEIKTQTGVRISCEELIARTCPGLVSKLRQDIINVTKTKATPVDISNDEKEKVIRRIRFRNSQNVVRRKKGKKVKALSAKSIANFLAKETVKFKVSYADAEREILLLNDFDQSKIAAILLKHSNVTKYSTAQYIIQGKILFVEQNFQAFLEEASRNR